MISNYSSIFELLCGYNFVNAVSNAGTHKDLLSFLDLSKSIKEKADEKKIAITLKLDKYLVNFSTNSNYEQIGIAHALRDEIKDIEYDGDLLRKRLSIFYLIAGITSFIILFLSASIEDFHTANRFYALIGALIILYLLLFKCNLTNHPKVERSIKNGIHKTSFYKTHEKKIKIIKIIILSILGLILILNSIMAITNRINIYTSNFLAFIFISYVTLIVFRKQILSKKAWTALYSAAFVLVPFMICPSFLMDLFYAENNRTLESKSHEIIYTLVAVFLLLFPTILEYLTYRNLLKRLDNLDINAIDARMSLSYNQADGKDKTEANANVSKINQLFEEHHKKDNPE